MKIFAVYARNGDRIAHIPYTVGSGLISNGIAAKTENDDEYIITDYHHIKKSGHTIVLQRNYTMVEVDADDYE